MALAHRLGGEQERVLKECQHAQFRKSVKNGSEGKDTFLSDTPFTPLALTMFAVLK
jgi:hypothetical protein